MVEGAAPESTVSTAAVPGFEASSPVLPENTAAQARAVAESDLRAAMIEDLSPLEAVRRAARASGLRRNEVYRLWLAIKQGAAR